MPKPAKRLLRISEIAKEAGVLPSTVRYYTDIGLLKANGATKGGHRLYEKDTTIGAIRKIQFFNQKGRTMGEIKNEILSSANKKKILVVDSDPGTGNMVDAVVREKFHESEVRTVQDGFSAGSALNEYIPDLIVLDLLLPGVNGLEICKNIRASRFLGKVKILALNGLETPEDRKKALEAGADDCLAKPLDSLQLAEKIARLTRMRSSQK